MEEAIVFNGQGRASRELNQNVKSGGVKGFLKCLTEEGKAWVFENHIATRGPNTGSVVYGNLQQVSIRFGWSKEEILKAKEEMEKAEAPKEEKKK